MPALGAQLACRERRWILRVYQVSRKLHCRCGNRGEELRLLGDLSGGIVKVKLVIGCRTGLLATELPTNRMVKLPADRERRRAASVLHHVS
jgi:hypothetical protein